ncbi:hypothetical protein SAMN05444365_101183 [Micromonospora pattaloongensis]|uniref:Uncharacterized protein n=1 Tax=Micromonospora pattaloongensis TaxID=405436 RepID=A0A1H3FW82_9ACTN|nr:hypothetical protein SAMN05444365_101183 [Micromonospora pattaloongensis]
MTRIPTRSGVVRRTMSVAAFPAVDPVGIEVHDSAGQRHASNGR